MGQGKESVFSLPQRLVSTLDDEVETDTEALWFAEAERRLVELRRGKIQGVDSAQAFRTGREALKNASTSPARLLEEAHSRASVAARLTCFRVVSCCFVDRFSCVFSIFPAYLAKDAIRRVERRRVVG